MDMPNDNWYRKFANPAKAREAPALDRIPVSYCMSARLQLAPRGTHLIRFRCLVRRLVIGQQRQEFVVAVADQEGRIISARTNEDLLEKAAGIGLTVQPRWYFPNRRRTA